MDMSSSCFVCNIIPNTPKRCSRCKNVIYCSEKCQTKDWKRHKTDCKINDLRKGFDSLLSNNLQLVDLLTAIHYGTDRFAIQNGKDEVVVIPQIIMINTPWKKDNGEHNAVYVLQKSNTKTNFIERFKTQFPNLKVEDIEKYIIVETTYFSIKKGLDDEDMDNYILEYSHLIILSEDLDLTTDKNGKTVLVPKNQTSNKEFTDEETKDRINRYKKLFKEGLSEYCIDTKDGLFKFISCFKSSKLELPLRNILYLQYMQLVPLEERLPWSKFNA